MKKTLLTATCALLAAGLALTGCKEKKAEKMAKKQAKKQAKAAA